MAPAAAAIALRARAFALAFTFGYLIRLASVSHVGRPEVAVYAPPIAVLVVVAFYVTVRALLLTAAVDAADLLVYVV